MKTSSFVGAFLVLTIPITSMQSATVPVPDATPYRVVERGADHQVWQRETYEPKANGTFSTRIHQYTELATGMNYWNNGQWQESKAEIDLLPGGSGAIATKGQHQVFFPPDIYSGAIELVTRDGKHLHARPLGISYDDGTNFVMIATLTNSVGQILPSGNQVIYPNAFSGFAADLVCTYRKSGFECDLVFREQPPTPKEAGLFQKTTRIQLLTEFFNTFDPDQINETDNLADGLTDQTLTFGKLKMVPGRAFMVGDNSPAIPNPAQPIKVSKQWLKLEGRKFLVEEVPYRKLRAQLQTLPSPGATASTATTGGRLQLSMKRVLPTQRPIEPGVRSMQLASVDWKEKLGVVLDYTTVNANVTNFTFQGDMTYFINGEYNLYGTTTIEGGAVIKYGVASNSPSLNVYGAVNCQTAPYRPVIFTAMDDDSVGEAISGSTGSPSGTYANRALDCYNSVTLKNLRMSYVNIGIVLDGGSSNVVQDCQFLNCSTPVRVYQSADARLLNVLFANVAGTAINSYQSTVTAEQVTAHKVGLLWTNDSSTLNLTNSLLISVTNLGSTFNGGYNATNASDSGIFQTVGGGDHYLATNSPYRNAGTTNIIPALRANLADKTTYPPVIFAQVTFSIATNLSPQAQRDTNNSALDLGYHYDPLDYVFGGCDLFTNLTLTAGTVITYYQEYGNVYSSYQPYGISLNDGASLSFQGTVAQPCMVVSYARAVQEGVNGNWLQPGWMGTIMINGSGSGFIPQLNSQFTKWNTIDSKFGFFRDNWSYGVVHVSNSEFYGGGFSGYAPSMYFTNCFFNRISIAFWDDWDAPNLTFLNCTFFNGMLEMKRYSWESPSFWLIKNCAFDGTMFNTFDELNANTNSTCFDYNTYNTANTSWMTYPFSWITDYGYGYLIPNTGVLEMVGPHDLSVTNYNWQTNRLGNFYLPSNSPLINAGSTTADQVGLYHFTTQTNQTKETNSTVDIGYHYVAVDGYGNPLDSNGNGIPDYLQDANGNGIVDNGENPWMPPPSFIIQPASQSVVQGSNATFSATVTSLAPVFYQWNFNTNTTLTGATNSTLTLANVQIANGGSYCVVVTNIAGSVTSTQAILAVYPQPPTSLTATGTNLLVNLNWSAISNVTTYNVKRSTVSGGPYTTIQTGVATNAYADSVVTNGTMYFYVVSAVNNWGEGGNSAEASAAPHVNLYWTGAINNSWNINTTTNWKTGSQTLVYLDGDDVFLDDAASNTSPVISVTVNPNSVTVNNTNKNYTISGSAISGSGSLTKNGPGTLTLSGTNTYTGLTTVSNGILLVNGVTGTNLLTVTSGATLGGTGVLNGPVTLSAGGTLAPGGLGTIGKLTLANNSAASLTLNGNNLAFILVRTNTPGTTYGQIAITGGSGSLVLNGASYLQLNSTTGTITNGVYTLLTYAGKSGSGTLTFPNGSLTNGNLILAVGATSVTLNVSANTAVGTNLTWKGNVNGLWDKTTTNWVNGASATIYNDGNNVMFDDTAAGNLTISGGSLIPGSVTFNNSAKNYSVSAVIAGSGSVSKFGSGTLTLAGTNTYTGSTFVNGGTLALATNNAFGKGLLVMNGGVLGASGGSARLLTNAVSLAAVNNVVDTSGGDLNLAGAITNAGALNKTSSGTLTLVNNNVYTGGTTISGGTLQLGDGTANNGAVAGNITNNAMLTYANPNAQIVSGIISGTGAVLKSGAGSLTLASTNTYSGNTTINAGSVVVTNGGAINSPVGTLNIGAQGGTAGTATLASGGAITVQTLLATNVVRGLSAGSIFNLNGGTLTTSNAATAANILVASNASFNINSSWNMNAGTNFIASVQTNGIYNAINIGSSNNNVTVTVNSRAVFSTLNPWGTPTNMTMNIGSGTAAFANRLIITNGGQVFLSKDGSQSGVSAQVGATGCNSNSIIVAGTDGAGQKATLDCGFGRLIIGGTGSGANNWIRIDAGGVITNGLIYSWGGLTNYLIITNGGQFIGGYGAIIGRSGIGHTWTVAGVGGDGGKSTLALSSGDLDIGGANFGNATPGTNNGIFVGAGGFITNASAAGKILVGADTNASGNYMVVTNGGQVFSKGAGVIGNTAYGNNNYVSLGGGTNSSVWNLGNANLTIGNNAQATNNAVTLFGGGVLTNVSSVIFGGVNSRLNFNGGTLAAGGNGNLIATNIAINATNYVQAGGVVIDSVTYNVTNLLPLLRDPNSPGGGLTKLGGGTLTLLGINTYTGPTTISAGTLTVNNNATISTGLLNLNGGTLSNSASCTLTNAVNLNAGSTVGVAVGQTLTLSGVVTNTANLTVIGAGTLLMNGNGGTATGTVLVTNNAALGGSGICGGSVVLAAGSSLLPGGLNNVGTFTLSNNLVLNGNIIGFDLSTNAATTNDRVVVGNSLIVNGTNSVFISISTTIPAGNYTLMTFDNGYSGSGTFVLAGLSSYYTSNATLVVNATNLVLQVGTGGMVYVDIWKGYVNGTWDASVLNWTNKNPVVPYVSNDAVIFDDTLVGNPIITNATPGATVLPGSMTFYNNLTNYTLNVNIAGTGSLAKSGSATVTLTGTNTYTGNTTINAGTLVVTNGGAINSPTATLLVNTGTNTLANGGIISIGTLLSTNVVLAGNVNSTFNFTGGTLTTSNNGLAANILLASNTTFNVGGNWNMMGGTNYVTSVQTNGAYRSVVFGLNASNKVVTVSDAVFSTVNPTAYAFSPTNLMSLYVGSGVGGNNVLNITNGGQVYCGAYNGSGLIGFALGITANNPNDGLIVAGANAAGSKSKLDTGGGRLYIGNAGSVSTNDWVRVDGGVITNVGGSQGGTYTLGVGSFLIITNGGQILENGGGGAVGRTGLGNYWLVAGADSAGNRSTFNGGGGALNIGGIQGLVDSAYSGTNNWLWVGQGGLVTNLNYIYVGGNTNALNNGMIITNGGQVFSRSASLIGSQNSANNNYVHLGGGTNNSLWSLGNASLTIGATAQTTNNSVTLFGGGVLTNVSSVILGGVNSRFNFNGGTLAAGTNGYLINTNSTMVNANTYVQANGAVIDCVTYNVTNLLPLLRDPNSTGGGLTKLGSGTLTLVDFNSYNGPTRVVAGTLTLSSSALIATSPSITLAGGATLDVSGLNSGFRLGSSQTLSNSATGAVLIGEINCNLGVVSLVYDGTNASFIITNGSLTLAAGTEFKLNNTGPTLGQGSYKLIFNATAGSAGLVTGMEPTNLTFTGSSISGTSSLQIVSGGLYLVVGGSMSEISYGRTKFIYNGLAQSPTISVSGINRVITTNYVGIAPTSYGPSINAPTNAGTYLVSNTVAAYENYFGSTNSTTFIINPSAMVSFSDTDSGLVINPAFCGLSYEKSQLTGNLFVSNNATLVAMFGQIAPAVLRIGGNSVDTTCWGGVSNLTFITPAQVDAFAGFVKALPTNWHVIYGLNMSVNSPTNCAAEAAYVANALGDSLLGFEIGNEPDIYRSNGLRPTNYTYSQFLSEWRTLAAAITNTVPGWAITNGGKGWTLTGPASANNTSGYTMPFATNGTGAVSLVTQHYFRGNGQSTNSTMALLLSTDTNLPVNVRNIVAAATAANLPIGFRYGEVGSFYNGGNAVSSQYGAALWTLDFMLTVALNGGSGVNFHGGGQSFNTYTPIADNGTAAVMARPELYGLKLFSLASLGGSILPATNTMGTNFNFSAYGVRQSPGVIGAILINKETNYSVQVTINLGTNVVAASSMVLSGPTLYSTSGYTLGGAAINADGSWSGGFQSPALTASGQLTVTVPPITALWLNPMTVETNAAPIIISQPIDMWASAGSDATFSVMAIGTAPLGYQWYFNTNTPLVDATNRTLTLTNVQATDLGSYSVVVANQAGAVTSSVVTLTVPVSPTITADPQSLTVTQAQNATFSVTATGTEPLSYQWRFNETDLAGANESSFTRTNAQAADAGNYTVVIMNDYGSVTSSIAVLTVVCSAIITSDPQSLTVTQAQSATFNVAATGTEPLSYQWQFNGTDLSGANESSFTRTNAQATDAGNYTVVIVNDYGSVTSSIAVLTVLYPATITTQPQSLTATQAQNASFSVTATGTAPFSYQWYFNTNTLLPGANNATLVLDNIQSANAGSYSVVVANAAGSVISYGAVLTVLSPPSIMTQPQSQAVLVGDSSVISVSALGSSPLRYQWYFNTNTLLAGATNIALTLTNVQPTNAGSYLVVVTNLFGSVTSRLATLLPVIISSTNLVENTNNVLLGYWPFNETNQWAGAQGQLPSLFTNIIGVPSWNSNAVFIVSTNSAIMTYRDVETNGNPNINLRAGTLRFWFKPDWDSGAGPGNDGRLIEVGDQNFNGWWCLLLNAAGTQIQFITQTNTTVTTNLAVTVDWQSNQWHQIVLTYGATNSMLYLDGAMVETNGLAVTNYPGRAVRFGGFRMGSDMNGAQQAIGTFDELETFNYPLESAAILTNYQAAVNLDSDGDGLCNLLANQLGLNPYATNSIYGLNATNALQVFTPLK